MPAISTHMAHRGGHHSPCCGSQRIGCKKAWLEAAIDEKIDYSDFRVIPINHVYSIFWGCLHRFIGIIFN